MNAVVHRPFSVLVTPEGFERLSRHLKAEDKANLMWFPNRLRLAVLDPLWSSESNADLDEREALLGMELATICLGLYSSLVRLISGDPEALIRLVEEAGELTLDKARVRISDQLGDAVWDSVEWAWYTQVEMARVFIPMITRMDSGVFESACSEVNGDLLAQDPHLKAALDMQLYTLAVLAAAERERDSLPVLTDELCHRAYAGACVVIDAARSDGFRIDPYRQESSEKRRERIARIAGQVLTGLSEEQLMRVDSSSLEHSTFIPEDSE